MSEPVVVPLPEPMRCALCDKEIKQGDAGCCVMFGYWKVIDGEDPDNNDFDPTGAEYDVCSECSNSIGTHIGSIMRDAGTTSRVAGSKEE